MLVVVTADQRASRKTGDRVPIMLDVLNAPRRESPYRSFERTAGDELQGVLGSAGDVLVSVERLLKGREWSVGIGVGAVDHPLPRSTRAGSGPAFVHARAAVEAAKHSPTSICVGADQREWRAVLEGVLMLWSEVISRRTRGGWEVAELVDQGLSRGEIARRLDISMSAVSQRASAASVAVAQRGKNLAIELLAAMMEEEA